jgi:hypothetical protein
LIVMATLFAVSLKATRQSLKISSIQLTIESSFKPFVKFISYKSLL